MRIDSSRSIAKALSKTFTDSR